MSAVRPIRVDATDFPLVVQTFDGKQTDQDVDEFLAQMSAVYARGEPFVTLTHIRDYALILSHVGRIGTHVKTFRRELCRASALVVPLPTFRFILSSFYLVYVPPNPVVVFDHSGPAEDWVLQRMRDEGMRVPPGLKAAG
jgi:hypothetical protein